MRAPALLTHISCLTRILRSLTRTTAFLMPHPYKGPVAYHEHWALNVVQITLFPQKIVLVCRSQKNQIAFYTLIKKTVFPHISISKALGHERAQFTLVGLPSGFTIAATFSRADPGAKRREKSLLQKQLPSSKPKPFPKESDRCLNSY